MSQHQPDVEALLAAILARASDVLELPEHDREARIKFFRNAAYEDRLTVTSNKDHANDFADRMEACGAPRRSRQSVPWSTMF